MDRVVALPRDRTLTVRPLGSADIDGLLGLYGSLSTEDLRKRFFSVYRPTLRFVSDWVKALTERGFGLVAEVSHGEESRLVADAGYVVLADGSGEFAITVDPQWRGWLGPYLLDALVQEAASRQVPALTAEVLVENRQMLALVRARGYVTVDEGDWTTVRVMIGTDRATPVWVGEHDRPRIIVESPGGRWRAQEPAREAGYQVMVCTGPGPGRSRCPAIEGRACPLVADADAIVFALPPDDTGMALLDAHARLHPGVPVCVTLGLGQELTASATPDVEVVTSERNPQRLVQLLHQITGGPPSGRGAVEASAG